MFRDAALFSDADLENSRSIDFSSRTNGKWILQKAADGLAHIGRFCSAFRAETERGAVIRTANAIVSYSQH